MAENRILIIDDEEIMQDVLSDLLSGEGFEIDCAGSGEQGFELYTENEYDLVVLDVMLPGENGIKILDRIKKLNPDQPVIMITAFASVGNAIEAMKKGADEYITKPFKNDEVVLLVNRSIEKYKLLLENRNLRQALHKRYSFDNIIGKNPRMIEIYDLISLIAPSRSTILVTGESGTGKELVAKAIHTHSTRASRPFVTVNSGSMPPDLLESNLFGHMRGSFTGAVANKKGLFEIADTGSIFFDEVGNISLETQAKLLRVMQEKEFMRLGGTENIRVDVRIVAATNSELKTSVEQGLFREDLYYRLNVIRVDIPPLRERKDDIVLLANHFVEIYCRENNRKITGLTPEFLAALIDYNWPGNVRELENVIERAVVLHRGEADIDGSLLPEHVDQRHAASGIALTIPPSGIDFKDSVGNYESALITKALDITGGVQKKAAELLSLKPSTLNEMIKRLRLKI
ncbi:MAG TPA: sigma-54 dependent transcriptional regulator [Acidobacteriota bacterium]|nr:sigma-54 dependent transcriptional regulator [Acidobacteriota bacterium]